MSIVHYPFHPCPYMDFVIAREYLVLTNQPRDGYNYTMIHRSINKCLVEAMADTPVVLVHGARQTGKRAFVRNMPHLCPAGGI